MAYDKGNFYHENGEQVIDDVIISNSKVGSDTTTAIGILSGATAPDETVLAVAGSLYVVTGAGIVGLYQNTGTSTVPVWTEMNAIDTDNYILTYSLPNQVGTATINTTAGTVDLVIAGTRTDIAATFTLSEDATAAVGGTVQVSGATTNTFTSPVTYTVTSEAGVAKTWTITVTLETYDLAINEDHSTTTVLSGATPVEAGTDVIDFGEVLTISVAAATGYTMSAFTVNEEAFTSGETHTTTGNVTTQATTTANEYTITYDANTGTGSDTQSATYDSEVTLNDGSGFTKTGYTISSWNTQADGFGTSYTLSETITYTTADDDTLYAIWTADTYTVSYDSNGGTGTIDDETATYDSEVTLNAGTNFTRESFVLDKWNTQADGLGTDYALSYEFTPYQLTSGLTLYAVWTGA